MTALTNAVLESGVIDAEIIAEMKRWGMPLDWSGNTLDDLPLVISKIREALESEDTVELRDTDLDVLGHYLLTKVKGHLVLPDHRTGKSHSMPVEYAVTAFGEYIIPWSSEGISDLLLDPKAYLRLAKPLGQDKPTKVMFTDVKELFFGSRKAFVACTAAKK